MAERLPTPTGTDCWNRIGVWARNGAGCPQLETLSHCHNCEVFMQAGRRMLDRPLERETIEERTRLYAQPAEDLSVNLVSTTLFRIGREWLSLPTGSIEEITDVRPVHRLPHRSGRILLGVISIRGQLHLAMSLAAVLGIQSEEPRSEEQKRLVIPRQIVMRGEQGAFAFRVDDVLGIYRYRDDAVGAVPDTLARAGARFVSGLVEIAGRQVGLLDVGLLAYGFEQALA